VTLPSYAGSVASYASDKKASPVAGSLPPGSRVNRHPRSSRMGSTTDSPIVSSRPSSRRTMTERCAHGHANDTMSW
jgi:hypothetical protein